MPQAHERKVISDKNSMEVAFEVTDENRLLLRVKADKFTSHRDFYERKDGLKAAIGVFRQALKNNPPAKFETTRVRVQAFMQAANSGDVAPSIDVELKRFDGSTVQPEAATVH